jgi:hypothetical protein
MADSIKSFCRELCGKIELEKLGKYVVVVAHPDDEVLWFSSVIRQASKVVICYGDYAGRLLMGPARRAALSEYPLGNVEFLDLDEPQSYGLGNWVAPRINDIGMELISRELGEIYVSNFKRLTHFLAPFLKEIDYLFTHNPWGEYGHEDHVQVGLAARTLAQNYAIPILVPNYYYSRSEPLMRKCIDDVGRKMLIVEGDAGLAKEIKEIYQKHDCWTWDNQWVAPIEECFLFLSARLAKSSPIAQRCL